MARTTDYPRDRGRVMRLLAGRKNCRDFSPAAGLAGVPKSSLDGRRESVFRRGDLGNPSRKLRLSAGEQLDVVGVTKRLGGESEESHKSYPSVTRIAADPWLRSVARTRPSELESLKQACEQLARKGLLGRTNETVFKDFPYEGAIVYGNRHHEFAEELGLDGADPDFANVVEALRSLRDGPGEGFTHFAVLVADGDRMGEAISRLATADDHRKFSETLARFAGKAKAIVNARNGVLVYAGGDDVLAFLPVDKCLDCARALHDEFGQSLAGFGALTLSVGIAIGHFMESLEDMPAWGRAAEKAAKGEPTERDGLAVHLRKRVNAPIRVRARWSDSPPLDERIMNHAEKIQGELHLS